MGFEDELRQMKMAHDNRFLNAGEIRKKMLIDVASVHALKFKMLCSNEAKQGHSFADMMVASVPVTPEDTEQAKTIIKRYLKYVIEHDIKKFTGPNMIYATNFVLPTEEAFFIKALQYSLKAVGIENAVIRPVSLFRTEKKTQKSLLRDNSLGKIEQVLDHNAFRISLCW